MMGCRKEDVPVFQALNTCFNEKKISQPVITSESCRDPWARLQKKHTRNTVKHCSQMSPLLKNLNFNCGTTLPQKKGVTVWPYFIYCIHLRLWDHQSLRLCQVSCWTCRLSFTSWCFPLCQIFGKAFGICFLLVAASLLKCLQRYCTSGASSLYLPDLSLRYPKLSDHGENPCFSCPFCLKVSQSIKACSTRDIWGMCYTVDKSWEHIPKCANTQRTEQCGTFLLSLSLTSLLARIILVTSRPSVHTKYCTASFKNNLTLCSCWNCKIWRAWRIGSLRLSLHTSWLS